MFILNIRGEKTFNSRGEQTIFVVVETKKGKVNASAPSGKSRGKYEAQPFSHRGIDFSISFINLIGKKLAKNKVNLKSFDDLKKVEEIVRQYDKTENWSLIGGNALFALEAAILKALAQENGKEVWNFLNPDAKRLPWPLGNCIGGGMHSKKEIHPDIQEFLLLPKSRNFYDSYFINLQAYKVAKNLVSEKDKTWNGELTDEKAICPSLTTEGIISILKEVKQRIGDKFKVDIRLGMDVAASTMWDGKTYN